MGKLTEEQVALVAAKAREGTWRIVTLSDSERDAIAQEVVAELLEQPDPPVGEDLAAAAFKRGRWRAADRLRSKQRALPASTPERAADAEVRRVGGIRGVPLGRIDSFVANQVTVDEELDRLPGDLGLVLDLTYRHGFTAAEIADAFGIKAATVHNKLSRARRLFREQVGDPAKLLEPDV